MSQKNKEKIQSKYAEFQLLSQQISQLEEHLNTVAEQINELNSLKNNLNELKEVKRDTEILVHLGHNIFTKSKIVDSNEFIIGIGASTLVKKNSKDAIEIISEQVKELNDLSKTMKTKVIEANSTLQGLHDELGMLMEKDSSE